MRKYNPGEGADFHGIGFGHTVPTLSSSSMFDNSNAKTSDKDYNVVAGEKEGSRKEAAAQ